MTDDEWTEYFETQARRCGRDGSPLYDALITRMGEDHKDGGVVAELLRGWEGNSILQGLAMRFLGAVHHLVLLGETRER